MKSKILHILRERGSYVSGQELCEMFGVSRTAVWKTINQLKDEGYEIEAIPNKGYHVIGFPDVISKEEVTSLLETKWAGQQMRYYASIDTTNNRAKQMAEEGAPHGTLIIADEQTMGKGRRGRSWQTPPKEAIAMSLIIRPDIHPGKASMLTLVMGLAAAQALREELSVDAKIKWPNDIVINGKKICGTLTEMSTEMNTIHYLVVGTGINVNIIKFPEEIAQIASSLRLETGKKINRAKIIASCMKYFEQYYERFMETLDFSILLEEYNQLLVNYQREVNVLEANHQFSGISHGINKKGELLVETEDGSICTVYAGEVSVRGIYGYV